MTNRPDSNLAEDSKRNSNCDDPWVDLKVTFNDLRQTSTENVSTPTKQQSINLSKFKFLYPLYKTIGIKSLMHVEIDKSGIQPEKDTEKMYTKQTNETHASIMHVCDREMGGNANLPAGKTLNSRHVVKHLYCHLSSMKEGSYKHRNDGRCQKCSRREQRDFATEEDRLGNKITKLETIERKQQTRYNRKTYKYGEQVDKPHKFNGYKYEHNYNVRCKKNIRNITAAAPKSDNHRIHKFAGKSHKECNFTIQSNSKTSIDSMKYATESDIEWSSEGSYVMKSEIERKCQTHCKSYKRYRKCKNDKEHSELHMKRKDNVSRAVNTTKRIQSKSERNSAKIANKKAHKKYKECENIGSRCYYYELEHQGLRPKYLSVHKYYDANTKTKYDIKTKPLYMRNGTSQTTCSSAFEMPIKTYYTSTLNKDQAIKMAEKHRERAYSSPWFDRLTGGHRVQIRCKERLKPQKWIFNDKQTANSVFQTITGHIININKRDGTYFCRMIKPVNDYMIPKKGKHSFIKPATYNIRRKHNIIELKPARPFPMYKKYQKKLYKDITKATKSCQTEVHKRPLVTIEDVTDTSDCNQSIANCDCNDKQSRHSICLQTEPMDLLTYFEMCDKTKAEAETNRNYNTKRETIRTIIEQFKSIIQNYNIKNSDDYENVTAKSFEPTQISSDHTMENISDYNARFCSTTNNFDKNVNLLNENTHILLVNLQQLTAYSDYVKEYIDHICNTIQTVQNQKQIAALLENVPNNMKSISCLNLPNYSDELSYPDNVNTAALESVLASKLKIAANVDDANDTKTITASDFMTDDEHTVVATSSSENHPPQFGLFNSEEDIVYPVPSWQKASDQKLVKILYCSPHYHETEESIASMVQSSPSHRLLAGRSMPTMTIKATPKREYALTWPLTRISDKKNQLTWAQTNTLKSSTAVPMAQSCDMKKSKASIGSQPHLSKTEHEHVINSVSNQSSNKDLKNVTTNANENTNTNEDASANANANENKNKNENAKPNANENENENANNSQDEDKTDTNNYNGPKQGNLRAYAKAVVNLYGKGFKDPLMDLAKLTAYILMDVARSGSSEFLLTSNNLANSINALYNSSKDIQSDDSQSSSSNSNKTSTSHSTFVFDSSKSSHSAISKASRRKISDLWSDELLNFITSILEKFSSLSEEAQTDVKDSILKQLEMKVTECCKQNGEQDENEESQQEDDADEEQSD